MVNPLKSMAATLLKEQFQVIEQGVQSMKVENQQAVESLKLQNHQLKESIFELEQAMRTEGWVTFTQSVEKEFTTAGRQEMMRLCRWMYLKNPLINRGVNIKSIYIWARGCSIDCEDETAKEALTAFFESPGNKKAFSGHQARTVKEQDLEVFGNIFFVLFSSDLNGDTQVRDIPAGEITKIISDPEDRKSPRYYLREYNRLELNEETGVEKPVPTKRYYPDMAYQPDLKRPMIGNIPVMWDSPVYHVKVGMLGDMQFGVPEVYCALDWARAYKDFLQDWCSIIRSYARWALEYNTKGGQRSVTDAHQQLSTTIGAAANASRRDGNPPPTAGAVMVTSGDNHLNAIKTSGATTSASEGAPILRMVCASLGVPETFLGDVSKGNHATAKTLDRPTELMIKDRQELWKEVYTDMGEYVIRRKTGTVNGELFLVSADAATRWVKVNFPDVLEHDITETIGAIVSASTLNGSATGPTFDLESMGRLMLDALGVPEPDEVMARLLANEEEAKAKADEIAANPPAPAASLKQAMEAFRYDLIKMVEKYGHALEDEKAA